MKICQKEFIQNKGSALLSCIYTIIFISLIMSSIILSNVIANSKDRSNSILPRIFTENRLNELYYLEDYELNGGTYDIFGDAFVIYMNKNVVQYSNGRSSFCYRFNYTIDDNGEVYLYNLEVLGE